MPFFKNTKFYSTLDEKDLEGRLTLGDGEESAQEVSIRIGVKAALALIVMILLSIVSSWVVFFGNVVQKPVPTIVVTGTGSSEQGYNAHKTCQEPALRREWRTLSNPEKQDYISAVQCLAVRPSKLHPKDTLYDDFPWVHKHLAAKTHVSAPFLPWHRMYIHLYEKALKEECGFSGALPYWDWSQDWEAPDVSPVWHSEFGLGGDGDIEGAHTVGEGRCVTDGPFAHITPMYYDGEKNPHCLSRGFPTKKELKKLGELIQPSAIENMMHENEYSAFEANLEKRAHHFLSHSVRGDLSRFTGPNDPVFFLHHTNIDRLWWQWQQLDHKRQFAYNGCANNITDAQADLADIMEFAGLSGNRPVVSVMETTTNQLCYVY